MIYLCSVYSLGCRELSEPKAKDLMQYRYEYAAKRTAQFMKQGYTIFCPINHCHPIADKYDMPREWPFWEKHDLNYIDHSSMVWVLMMPGWKESRGIQAEIEHAVSIGKPIAYVACPDYSENWLENESE